MCTRSRRSVSSLSIKPILARCLVVAVLAAASSGLAAEPEGHALREGEAIAQALGRAALVEAVDARIAIVDGQRRMLSAYPNPEVAYTREQTFGAAGTTEDYLSVSQLIDLGNRRGLRGEAAEASTGAVHREIEGQRRELAAEARRRFYAVLYEQERVKSLEGWTARIDEARLIVSRREASGDAALYDRRRLEREHAVANGRLDTERATLEGTRARLAAMLGRAERALTVTGVLLPEGDPPELPTLQGAIETRPELVALDRRLDAAARERQAAARWWLPDVRLEAGWKGVDLRSQGGRSDGFLVGASLALPLWDQSSGQAQVADGEARLARARRDLLATETENELSGARAQAVQLRRAAAEFRQRAEAASGDLVHIAAAGYGGGELGLLELLDAYRGAADDALMALELALGARKARIELDRMTGVRLP